MNPSEFEITHVNFGHGWQQFPPSTDPQTLTLTLPPPPEGATGWRIYTERQLVLRARARRRERQLRKALHKRKKQARARTGRR